MRQRGRTGLTILLGVIATVAVILSMAQYRQAKAAKVQLEASRQRALYSLVADVENIEASLAKARAASTMGQQTTLLTASYSKAQSARESLAQVVVPGVDFTNVRQFIARTGDYCLVLSQRLARGGAVTPAEWSELARLEAGVKDLSSALLTTLQKASLGGTRATFVGVQGFKSAALSPADALSQGFSEIDQLTQSIPSPVYDGPFSERNQALLALARPGPPISAEDAKNVGLGFLNPGESYQTVSVGVTEGSIPSYLVTGKRADGSEVMTAVAKQGGAVLWAQDGRDLGIAKHDIQAARDAAGAFLSSKGFSGLKETGWRKPGPRSNRIVFTFVSTTWVRYGGTDVPVILYPDTVKVEVGLDSGRAVAFDQRPYLTTHDNPMRAIPSPLISREEARAVLKMDLKVLDGSPRLTVIPILPTTEALAWEFRAQQGDDTYLIYVNAMTGKEDVVLHLIEDDTGAMAV